MNMEQLLAMFYTPIHKSARYITTLEHDSLIADTVKNVIYWNSIGKTFTPYQFLKFHGVDDSEIEEYDLEISINFNIYDTIDTTYQQQLFYGDINNCFSYFVERGLNEETVSKFNLEVKSNAVLLPIIKDGKRIGAIYRFLTMNKQKRYVVYANEPVQYWPHYSFYKTVSKTAFLFEGYFSTMRWTQMFNKMNKCIHCYSLMNARPTLNKLSAFEKYNNVFYIADCDATGINASMKIKEIANWIKVVIPPKMPDEMSEAEMLTMLKGLK